MISIFTVHNSTSKVLTRLFALLGIIIILIFIGITGYSLLKYKNATAFFLYFRDKQAFQKIENDYMLSMLKKIALLPEEDPTIATVTDKTKLETQPFFNRAENGDIVFLFTETKKAYLFRPKTSQLIEVGPLNIQPEQKNDTKQIIIPTNTTVALFNGTTKVGLTSTYEIKLLEQFPTVSVSTKTNAKQSYEKSMIIAASSEFEALALQLSTLLSIPVEKLPDEELFPTNTQILIILGNDAINTTN